MPLPFFSPTNILRRLLWHSETTIESTADHGRVAESSSKNASHSSSDAVSTVPDLPYARTDTVSSGVLSTPSPSNLKPCTTSRLDSDDNSERKHKQYLEAYLNDPVPVCKLNSDKEDDGEDEPSKKQQGTPLSPEAAQLQLYTPHDQWAWTCGKGVEGSKVLMKLGAGSMCFADIKSGTIGRREIIYLSRSWPLANKFNWIGFYSELALYKSERYLRHFQGVCVPRIIGVFVNPNAINIAMEVPHPSFWFTASPDMPDVLKERCIEAFNKIHSCGVLHGDVQLRHMLIGGDATVTIIDFHQSRAQTPYPPVKLAKANSEEFALEMRKVKYKLDYEGARVKEAAKMERYEKLLKPKAVSFGMPEGRTILDGVVEQLSAEDMAEPPPSVAEWKSQWVQGPHDDARRKIVVPGQTPEQVERATREFTGIVRRMEDERFAYPGPTSLDNNSGPPHCQIQRSMAGSDILDVSDGHHHVAKRKATDSASSLPPTTKRARLDDSTSITASPAMSMQKKSSSVRKHTSSSLRSGSQASSRRVPTSSTAQRAATATLMRRGVWIPSSPAQCDAINSTMPDPPPSGEGESASKPVKVLDYVDEPYDGTTGYYVPHPPTEATVGVNRVRHIRKKNAECHRLGLPYPDRAQYGRENELKGPPPAGTKYSLGQLKRIEKPYDTTPLEPQIRVIERAPGHESRPEFGLASEHLDLKARSPHRRLIDTVEFRRRLRLRPDMLKAGSYPRGILCKTTRVKTVRRSCPVQNDPARMTSMYVSGPIPVFPSLQDGRNDTVNSGLATKRKREGTSDTQPDDVSSRFKRSRSSVPSSSVPTTDTAARRLAYATLGMTRSTPSSSSSTSSSLGVSPASTSRAPVIPATDGQGSYWNAGRVGGTRCIGQARITRFPVRENTLPGAVRAQQVPARSANVQKPAIPRPQSTDPQSGSSSGWWQWLLRS